MSRRRCLWMGLSIWAALSSLAGGAEVLRLHGRVVDEQGVPEKGVRVSLKASGETRSTETNEAGAFELVAPPSAVRGQLLRAHASDGRRQASVQIPWDDPAGAMRQAVELRLAAARRIETHVTADGKAVEGQTVGVMGAYALLETATTNGAGQAELWTPPEIDVQCVFALSQQHGVDYRSYVLPRGEAGDQRAAPPKLPDGPIELALDGARKLRVRLVEPGDVPLRGVRVYPWLLRKPSETDKLNLSYFPELAGAVTDDDGYADFNWLPSWQAQVIQFWPMSEQHVRQRGTYDPASQEPTLTITLDRLVPVRGRVTDAEGSPLAGVTITASGQGYMFDDYRGSATTDAEGRYQLDAAPNMVYLITAQLAKLAGEPHTGFAVMPGEPVDDLDFQLQPASRLFGRVTLGGEAAAVAGQHIAVYQYGQDANNLKDVVLPNPENSNLWVQPIIVRGTTTDEDGRFEMWLGPGKYDVRGPQQAEVQKFEVADQAELEFNFHSDRPERGLLRGLVTADRPEDAIGAKVTGIYRHGLAGLDLVATVGADGKFEVQRELHRTVLHAVSADGKLAGVVEIGPDDKLAVIHLRPLARALGRLVDAAGQPLADQEITYGSRVHIGDDDAPFRTEFGGRTTSDQTGRFVLAGVVQEIPYEVSVTIRSGDAPQQVSWRNVAEFQAPDAHDVELGDVTFKAAE